MPPGYQRVESRSEFSVLARICARRFSVRAAPDSPGKNPQCELPGPHRFAALSLRQRGYCSEVRCRFSGRREGDQIHPRVWNYEFIQLPLVIKENQSRPTVTEAEISDLLKSLKERYAVLVALVAGTIVLGASLAAVRISTNWRRAPFPTSDTSLLARFERIHRSRQCCHPQMVAGFSGLRLRVESDSIHHSACCRNVVPGTGIW
jgi:hypothetical protein